MKRPGYLGTFTNSYVYNELPKGTLEKLRELNPKNDNGGRNRKHHQHLTEEIGLPHLDKHLMKLITVMELSDNMTDFKTKFAKVFNKPVQTQIDFGDV